MPFYVTIILLWSSLSKQSNPLPPSLHMSQVQNTAIFRWLINKRMGPEITRDQLGETVVCFQSLSRRPKRGSRSFASLLSRTFAFFSRLPAILLSPSADAIAAAAAAAAAATARPPIISSLFSPLLSAPFDRGQHCHFPTVMRTQNGKGNPILRLLPLLLLLLRVSGGLWSLSGRRRREKKC